MFDNVNSFYNPYQHSRNQNGKARSRTRSTGRGCQPCKPLPRHDPEKKCWGQTAASMRVVSSAPPYSTGQDVMSEETWHTSRVVQNSLPPRRSSTVPMPVQSNLGCIAPLQLDAAVTKLLYSLRCAVRILPHSLVPLRIWAVALSALGSFPKHIKETRLNSSAAVA